MRKVFSRFDTDGDGRISPSELAAVSRAIAPPATESARGREVASMMEELDTDRDGYVDLGEFAAFHGRGRGEHELDAELRDAFDVYDINGDGRISGAELNKVLSWIAGVEQIRATEVQIEHSCSYGTVAKRPIWHGHQEELRWSEKVPATSMRGGQSSA
ncbi:putative calcium-binding protein CML16 [Hordeum vulgare]|nr:putative calcium-binding protein CML16 [Hordeum vulgare]